MPTWRQRSPIGTPVVACCSTAVICSTEKRFFFTATPTGPVGRIVPQNSLSVWTKKRGAPHQGGPMKRSKFTDEQILAIVKEGEAGDDSRQRDHREEIAHGFLHKHRR